MNTQSDAKPNPLPQYDYYVYFIFFLVNTLSIIGQLFTVCTYRSIRNKNNKFYGYIAWHSLIGLPWVFSNYLTIALARNNDGGCKVAAIVHHTSYLAYLIWSSVIALVILTSLRKQTKIHGLKTWYIVLTYALSFMLMYYPIVSDSFGPFHARGMRYCSFVSANARGLAFKIGYHYPLMVTTVFNIICYVWSLYLTKANATSEEHKQAFKSFLYFPLISLVCNSQFILRRAEIAIAGRHAIFYFEIVHRVLATGQGLFEALVYWFKVKIEIKRSWVRANRRNQKRIHVPLVFDESSIENEVNERARKQIMSL